MPVSRLRNAPDVYSRRDVNVELKTEQASNACREVLMTPSLRSGGAFEDARRR